MVSQFDGHGAEMVRIVNSNDIKAMNGALQLTTHQQSTIWRKVISYGTTFQALLTRWTSHKLGSFILQNQVYETCCWQA